MEFRFHAAYVDKSAGERKRGSRRMISAVAALSAMGLIVCGGLPALASSLRVETGPSGLVSLAYDDHEFIARTWSGQIRPVNHTPKLLGTVPRNAPATTVSRRINRAGSEGIETTFDWGVVVAFYRWQLQRLTIDVEVQATTEQTIERLDLSIAELTYPSIPEGRTFDAGMFGVGGNWTPLDQIYFVVNQDLAPPVIRTRYGEHTMAFALERATPAARAHIAIPFTLDKGTKRVYPIWLGFEGLKPRVPVTATISLRFAASTAAVEDMAGDIIAEFRKRYPRTLSWPSSAPIGALFLATSQAHPPGNPRGWFLNARDVDIATAQGLAAWRRRLLQYADTSIGILEEVGGQGMIVWDVEGQEFASATFIGDPRLASRLAPETGYASEDEKGALDAFFDKFKAQGFRVGVTLRPQRIEFGNGLPRQMMVEDPLSELSAKAAYAHNRWGCTLFYVDSTYEKSGGALAPEVMSALAARFPDSLFIPENETLRYFANTAPLNSFAHHGVAGTPASVLEVYPQAISAILMTAPADRLRAGASALRRAMERGDIMVFNAWYRGPHVELLREARGAAGRQRTDGLFPATERR